MPPETPSPASLHAFGEALRLARFRKRLSLRTLAALLGLQSHATVHRWEHGLKRPLKPETLHALATVLDVPVSEFVAALYGESA